MSKQALVVGINCYAADELGDLPTPARDAEDIARILENYGGFHVRRLPACIQNREQRVDPNRNNEAKWENLKSAIADLFNPQNATSIPDTALLFFAGHGWRDEYGRTAEGYLAAKDAKPANGGGGVSLKWLCEELEKSPIRQQIVWLDCCYSGEFVSYFREKIEQNSKSEADRCFIAACREYEEAFQQASGARGVLGGALLEALDPRRQPDGWVTNKTLAEQVKRALSRERQRPLVKNYGKTAIVLTTSGTATLGTPDRVGCPYKGLEYFDEKDAEVFCGRDALTKKLLEKVRDDNFIFLVGPSGCGKSSILRAGLLYKLRQGAELSGSDLWNTRLFTPGADPFQTLSAIGKTRWNRTAPRSLLIVDQFEECLTLCQDSEKRRKFFEALLVSLAKYKEKLCLLLAMRADFLGECLQNDLLASYIEKYEVTTVSPMKPEELHRAIAEPAKKAGWQIEPRSIVKMLEDVKDAPGSLPLLQSTLTELWMDPDNPNRNKLTLDRYNELGGVKQALQKQADRAYNALSWQEQQVAKRIFIELTTCIAEEPQIKFARRPLSKKDLMKKVTYSESPETVQGAIAKLADARLLVTSKNERGDQNEFVELVHEALIRHWQLGTWAREDWAGRKQRDEIQAKAEEWQAQGRSKHFLLREPKLVEAENFSKNYQQTVLLSQLAAELVAESRQELEASLQREKERQQRELEQERKARRAAQKTTVVAIISTILVTGLAIVTGGFAIFADKKRQEADESATFAENKRREAEQQTLIANLRRDAAEVKTLLSASPVDGLVLAIEATGKSQSELNEVIPPVRASLFEAIDVARERNIVAIEDRDYHPFDPPRFTSVSFSPDGETIVGLGEGRLFISDKQGNSVIIEEYGYNAVSFSPDGENIIGVSYEGIVQLWDRKGKQITELFRGRNFREGVVSPGGQHIIDITEEGVVQLWYINQQRIRQLFEVKKHSELDVKIFFSSDGQYFIVAAINTFEDKVDDKGYDYHEQTLQLWDLEGNKIGRPFRCENLNDIAISAKGRHIVGGIGDGTISLWDKEGSLIKSFRAHEGEVSSVAISLDGETLVSGGSGGVRFWDMRGNASERFDSIYKMDGGVEDVTISSDGQSFAGITGDILNVWDAKGNLTGTLNNVPRSGEFLHSFDFSPDGKYIVSGYVANYSVLRLWDVHSGLVVQPFWNVQELSLSHNGQHFVRRQKNAVQFFDLQGGLVSETFWDSEPPNLTTDGRYIFSMAVETTQVWDLQGNLVWKKALGNEDFDTHRFAAISPDATYIVSKDQSGGLRIWDLQNNPITETISAHTAELSIDFGAVLISPDSQYIVNSGLGKVQIWDRKGNFIQDLWAGGSVVVISPDSRYIVTNRGDDSFMLWDKQGNPVGEPFRGHIGEVSSVAFSPDSKYIASGGWDRTVRVWDLEGNQIAIFQGSVNSVAFSPDGQYIVGGSLDNVLVWRFADWEYLLQVGCDRLRYHPILKEGTDMFKENEAAKGARETCQKYAWKEVGDRE